MRALEPASQGLAVLAIRSPVTTALLRLVAAHRLNFGGGVAGSLIAPAFALLGRKRHDRKRHSVCMPATRMPTLCALVHRLPTGGGGMHNLSYGKYFYLLPARLTAFGLLANKSHFNHNKNYSA